MRSDAACAPGGNYAPDFAHPSRSPQSLCLDSLAPCAGFASLLKTRTSRIREHYRLPLRYIPDIALKKHTTIIEALKYIRIARRIQGIVMSESSTWCWQALTSLPALRLAIADCGRV